jgi:hypothetical protein
MAQVEFKSALVKAHGYPQACLTCGNDEDDQLVSRELTDPSKGALGCGCLLFFFGPIGWLIAAIVVLVARRFGKSDVRVPVCRLCNAAVRALGQRAALILTLAGALFCVDAMVRLPFDNWWCGLSLVVGLYGLCEYAWLMRQFNIHVLKMNSERVIVETPNDDYPGLYQRHLDNAVLYGSSESTGTRAEA